MHIRFFLPLVPVLLLFHCGAAPANDNKTPPDRHVHLRGSLQNSQIQFQRNKKGHVAFIGGSITAMNGYRPMVCQALQKRFPNTKFTFTDAGISSTCSTTGAFRLERDVFSRGPVDLFFIEFAVNDDQDAMHQRRDCVRGMEGIIRQTRARNPNADIVITYFVNPGMLAKIQAGKTPVSIASHQAVAEHYNVSTIHLASHVAGEITAGRLSWEKYGGTHPKPLGNAICAQLIDRLLDNAWQHKPTVNATATAHRLPSERLDAFSYDSGRLVSPSGAKLGEGWEIKIPAWKKIAGQCRARFLKRQLLCGEQIGAELTLSFSGRAIGAYLLAGPDAGHVQVSIDGSAMKQIELYHHYSRNLHYPRTVMFAADLSDAPHTLKLRISQHKNKTSSGHAVRILDFVAN